MVSKHHCIALDYSRTVFTWGKGEFGQLCQGNNKFSNIPVPNEEFKSAYVVDVEAGMFFSCLLTLSNEILIYGKIDSRYEFDNSEIYSELQGYKPQKIKAGSEVLVFIDTVGSLFCFNETEGVVKLPSGHSFKEITVIDMDIYALNTAGNLLYHYKYDSKPASLFYYSFRILNINPEVSSNLEFANNSWFNDIIFFSLGIWLNRSVSLY